MDIPPTIPASILCDSNYTYNLQSDTVYFDTINLPNNFLITNSTTSSSGITGLRDPIHNSEAATKNYVDTLLKVTNDPNYSIQLNGTGQCGISLFTSSSLYLYKPESTITSSTTNQLIAKAFNVTDGTNSVLLTNNKITGLSNMNTQTQGSCALTKLFFDNSVTLTTSTSSSLAYTYTPLLTRYIRTPSGDSTDTFDTAINVYTNNTITKFTPTSFPFMIENQSNYTITISDGTGNTVTPTGPTVLRKNSILKGLLTIVNGTSANIYIENIYRINDSVSYFYNNIFFSDLVVSGNYNNYTSVTEILSTNYTYTLTDIPNIIHRNSSGVKTDSFISASNFQVGSFYFTIKNTSASGSVIISNANGWTVDDGSDNTIPINKTCILLLTVDQNFAGSIRVIAIS